MMALIKAFLPYFVDASYYPKPLLVKSNLF